jgi:O-acetyl-ADP-ribose deacetylase (regulator of RNase III)
MNRYMALEIVTGDVLDLAADALLLTIDGVKRGMEGNIARQFERRWPDDWKDLQRTVRYPVPLGRAVAVPWHGDFPWRLVLFASTLHHLDVLDDQQKRGVTRSSLFEALQLCDRHRASSLATAVLQGGWRLSPEEALLEMQTAYQAAGCPHVRLLVSQRMPEPKTA